MITGRHRAVQELAQRLRGLHQTGGVVLLLPLADAEDDWIRGPDRREDRVRLGEVGREQVRARNVYRWAGAMLLDAARLRQRQRVSERIDEHRRMAGLDVK